MLYLMMDNLTNSHLVKVGYSDGTKGQLQIINILSGGTFTTPRSNGVGMGMYLKIDSNNNTPFVRSRGSQYCYAVNLETGQVREFSRDKMVTPVKTEVNVIG